MATEALASPSRHPRDFRSKIHRYQECFRSASYRRYEETFGCGLRGFRLLVVTSSLTRLASLCRLVREIPPTDFVWLTRQEAVLQHGMSAEIWSRGGHLETPAESIVGSSLAGTAPLLPIRP
jgi:hypothetical protein